MASIMLLHGLRCGLITEPSMGKCLYRVSGGKGLRVSVAVKEEVEMLNMGWRIQLSRLSGLLLLSMVVWCVSSVAYAQAAPKEGILRSTLGDDVRSCRMTWQKSGGKLTLELKDCPGIHASLPTCGPDDIDAGGCATTADCGTGFTCNQTSCACEAASSCPSSSDHCESDAQCGSSERCDTATCNCVTKPSDKAMCKDGTLEADEFGNYSVTADVPEGQVQSYCFSVPESAYAIYVAARNHGSYPCGSRTILLRHTDLLKYSGISTNQTSGEPFLGLSQLGGRCGWNPPGCTAQVPGGTYEMRITGGVSTPECESLTYQIQVPSVR